MMMSGFSSLIFLTSDSSCKLVGWLKSKPLDLAKLIIGESVSSIPLLAFFGGDE